ncbi:MAG TPA: hypothetical protein VIF60_17840 [Burkholderiaceae bacterium]
MSETNLPSKYVIREYLARRSHSNRPPPSLEEIRRQLGWQLLKPGALQRLGKR